MLYFYRRIGIATLFFGIGLVLTVSCNHSQEFRRVVGVASNSPANEKAIDTPKGVKKIMTTLEHECMAAHMAPTWVAVGGGLYAGGYIDEETTPPSLYLCNDLTAQGSKLPYWGPISRASFLEADRQQRFQVVLTQAPIRYVKNADETLTPGFFEPRNHVFFRWIGESRTADRVNFDPTNDAVSPIVEAARIQTYIDVVAPTDTRDPF